MGLKTLLHEVMEAMGKDTPDEDAVDMASDVLKLTQARQMLSRSIHDRTRLASMRVIASARQTGAEAVYMKVLERRVR